MNHAEEVCLSGTSLTVDQVSKIAHGALVKLDPDALLAVQIARATVQEAVQQREVIYGITTGFGSNSDIILQNREGAESLQENLLLTHAVCVGDPLSPLIVRGMIAIRINTLLRGHSGLRPIILERLAEFLNHNILPIIPEKGSVGASGDLAPLSHMALPLIGQGEVLVEGQRINAREGLAHLPSLKDIPLDQRPLRLTHKEGLALINGTTLMAAIAALSSVRMKYLLDLADISVSMTAEACCGRSDAFREDVHALRPHPGQQQSARNIRTLLDGSQLINLPFDMISRRDGSWSLEISGGGEVCFRGGKAPRPQDSYSIRCAPQVHGACRDALSQLDRVLEIELNSVTDNPIIFPELSGEARFASAGHFHGMPIALALSYLKVSIPSLASISERRTNKLLDAATSDGLPPFLSRNADGSQSGYMIIQYTAAALVNDLASRAHPTTVFSIPTSANMEDHVSMGANEARHVYEMLDDLERVLAIELMTAAQAIDIRTLILDAKFWPKPENEDPKISLHRHLIAQHRLRPAPRIQAVHAYVRAQIDFLAQDRSLSSDIQKICEVVREEPQTIISAAGI